MFGPLSASGRQLVTIVAAVVLPLLAVIAVLGYTAINDGRQSVERLSTQRADEIVHLADQRVQADLRMATALASTPFLRSDDLPGAYRRAREYVAISDGWKTVIVSDPAAGTQLFDLRRPLPAAAQPIAPAAARFAASHPAAPSIAGIEPDPLGGHAVVLQAPVIQDGQTRYVLTILVAPETYHRLAMPFYPPHTVGALVDRDGRFISRNINFTTRVGALASTSLRAAIRRGPEGSYRGRTLEGLVNYTAYATSPLTGWSAHIAVDSAPLDGARRLALIVSGGVGLLGLALAVVVVALTVQDMMRARANEERLRQAQKMEAVGQLTGGIAHDFNNLLTAIIGGVELVLARTPGDSPNRRYLDAVKAAALKGAALTSRLLAFSRIQRMQITAVDVRSVLEGMNELLDQSLGPRIQVRIDVDPSARWVRTDRNQLELALLNLAVNARDAMPDGGRLTFSTRPGPAADRVEIAVSDTGVGMTRDVADRAFDPFFTTKPVNQGTGLGLSQVFGLARQSQGSVSIDSAPGQGATVRMLLPVGVPEAAPSPAPSAPTGAPAPSGGSQSILVLDDDDQVRDVLVESLRARGYVVFEVATGEQALEAVGAIKPDLLIMDYMMPGLNGAEVGARVRAIRPEQKLLLISGHLDSEEISRSLGDVPILQKPFDSAALLRTVAQQLGAPPVAAVAETA